MSVSLCPTSGQRRADTSGEVSNWVFNVLWTTQSSQDDTSWEDFLKNIFLKNTREQIPDQLVQPSCVDEKGARFPVSAVNIKTVMFPFVTLIIFWIY